MNTESTRERKWWLEFSAAFADCKRGRFLNPKLAAVDLVVCLAFVVTLF
jgi:hypothetical protein